MLKDEDVPFNLDKAMTQWVKDEVATLDNAILIIGCTDFAQYKHLTGQRQGLLKVQARLQELYEEWNNRG
jgi:predicted KAP-like P-loop ATPase